MLRKTCVLRVSCQEPSKSTKSPMLMVGSLHTFNWARKFKFGRNVWNHILSTFEMSRMTMSSMSPARNPQRPPSTPYQGQGVLETLLIILECWNLALRSGIKCEEQIWGQRWSMSSMSLVRNTQRPPSALILDPHSWHTSNKDIDTKLSGYLS